MNVCLFGGTLVGRAGWLPSAPFDFRWRGLNQPPIGCNNIVCGECGASVRSIAGYAPLDFQPSAAYDLDDAPITEHLQADEDARLYFCRCRWTVQSTYADLQRPNLEPPRDFVSEWECDGHPPLPVPTTLDGERIGAAADMRPLAERRLGDLELPLPDDLRPVDLGLPSFWLIRLYRLLEGAGSPLTGALSEAVGELLLSREALVRFGAVCFVWAVPEAEAAARLAPAVAGHPELFEGPVGHPGQEWDLGLQTSSALLNRRAVAHDAAALDAIKALADGPGIAGSDVLFVLGAADPDWLLAHASQIVERDPLQVEPLVHLLRHRPPDPLADQLVAMARLDGVGPGTIRRLAERYLDEDVAARVTARLDQLGPKP